MNLLQLILKNMRQRALSTSLTMLSVVLGVALAIGVLIFQREGERLFVQSDFGYNLIVGPKGDPLQLVLNTTYGLGKASGTIPWSVYDDLMRNQQQYVQWALPFLVGDTFKGKRIMATGNRLVETPALRTFRDTLAGLDEKLSPEAIDARLAKLDGDAVASLDVELLDRLKELRQTLADARAKNDATGVADALRNLRLLGSFARPFEYRADTQLSLAAGTMYDARKFESVVGSAVAKELGVTVGSPVKLEHGGNANDVHDETWTCTGILAPTNTAIDQTVFIPTISALCVPEHEEALEQIAELQAKSGVAPANGELVKEERHDHHGHDDHDHEEAYTMKDGRIELSLDRSKWKVSGIFAMARGALGFNMMQFRMMNLPYASVASPAEQMRNFFGTFMKGPTLVLVGLAAIVSVVAAVSILVSIYNSVTARRREIAILRSLGATRGRVLAIITLEATLIGVAGGAIGLLVGHAVAAAGARILERNFGQTVNVFHLGLTELVYLAAVVVLATLAGLVPALQAYRVPVAQNLAGE